MIVEDDRAITQSLMRLLSREGYFIHAVPSGEEGVAHLRQDPSYDLALLDVALPGMDGFACCRALRDQGWRGPILMLTGRGGGADKITGLTAGADDYITKPFAPGELLARIQAHLRRTREYAVPEEEAREITLGPDLVLDLRIRDAIVRGEPAHLTDREYEVLLLLARHRGTALDKLWLFQQVWGNAPKEGIKALAVYVRRLRQKIEQDENNPRYIQTVRGFGYKLMPQEE
ncbi:MAG: response regulator transcription factor [Armatimonadota bacterium]|nr:response regulator transcription factor [Armatimonadota bacterium]